jgi:heat shock protein HspQ
MVIAEEEDEEGEGEKYKLYAPHDEEPYDTYASLEALVEDLEDIKRLSPDWEDWQVQTPSGHYAAAWELT